MQAKVTLTIHGIDALNAVQIAHLTERITDLFGLVPGIFENDMMSSFLTDDHKRVFQVVENLNVELARKFSTRLWTSINTQEAMITAKANNICTRRSADALPVLCETLDCEQLATYDCYPAVALGVTSLLTKIALCEQHAREVDPGLQREARHG